MADGTMAVIVAKMTTVAAVARGGDSCGRVFWRRRVVAEGRQKIEKPFGNFIRQRGAVFLTLS